MLNLHSGYNDIKKIYDENKEKPWGDWLKTDSFFPRTGKQGILGLFSLKDPVKVDENKKYVFKISQYINYLVQHEYTVGSSMNNIADFCPHFCRVVGMINCMINPSKKDDNIFDTSVGHPIQKEVLLLEHVKDANKFCKYIFSEKVSEAVLFSIVKQVLFAIKIGQDHENFTHYDLHSNNILLKKCDSNLVVLYSFGEKKYLVPTYGYCPVIIDYGFSYAKNLSNGPLWCSLEHTDIGFLSDRFDPIADLKLFLITVSSEIHENRESSNSKKFFNIVKNIFRKLPVDWNSGWDRPKGTSESQGSSYSNNECAVDDILKLTETYKNPSKTFKEYPYYCIDILQSLIIAPLEHQDTSSIRLAYETFVSEFVKIEESITSKFFCIYILKGITDIAREIREDYSKKESRENAVKFFRLALDERIKTVASFCTLKNFHYEKMLCSLYCLTKSMEGILYTYMQKKIRDKNSDYEKLEIKTCDEVYDVLEEHIPSSYTFNKKTKILLVDSLHKRCELSPIPEKYVGTELSQNSSEITEIYNSINKCLVE